MAFLSQQFSLHSPFLLPFYSTAFFFPPKQPPSFPASFKLLSSSPSSSSFSSPSSSSSMEEKQQQAMLQAVSLMEEQNSLPCVRSYDNDIARLSVSGSVASDQALIAAAADGGDAADEHLSAGLSAMVVETLFPGPVDERSTVSTRLFLPAMSVKEKARKLRHSLSKDFLSSTDSKNILAMTFRQVVLQQLWNLELDVFVPGSQRNMEDPGSQREATRSFALSSSDEKVIRTFAEVLCNLSFETTQREFFHKSSGKASRGFFNWLSEAKKFASKDSSIIVYNFEDVLIANAKNLFDKFKFERTKFNVTNKQQTSCRWPSMMHSKFEKIGGSEFSVWTSEYVPAYKIEIDADQYADLKFEGWERTTGNRWEVPLTHSQMVGLTNLLDMYFEDAYTLPYKQLSCNIINGHNKLSKVKKGFSLFHFLRTTLTTATLLLVVGVMVKISLPHMKNTRKRDPRDHHMLQTSAFACEQIQPLLLEPSKVEAFCSIIVSRIKDVYGWDGDIEYEPSVGAWIGEVPIYLRNGYRALSSGQESVSSNSDVLGTDDELMTVVQNIASYQVVLSKDGKVVGFQPTSGIAVNHWSSNPIAKELYDNKILSPGLVEPGLKIKKPNEVIILELLMSSNQDKCFALARQMQWS